METIKNYLNQPIIAGAVGLVIGVLFGLIVLGWWLFPVQWTDGSPADLTYDYQVDYMRMAIDSFNQNGDGALAQVRYNSLGEDAATIYSEIVANPAGQTNEVITAFGTVVGASQVVVATPVEGGLPTATVFPEEETGGGGLGSILPWICGLGLLILLAAGAIFYFFFYRPQREELPEEEFESMPARSSQAEIAVEEPAKGLPPTAKFMASYHLGDELYDESFSIDSPSGEFLGECGVGVSETIGVGETRKVTAFEVWLFDKNDIQTVTKVLMSSYAYSDTEIRNRLSAKGEPVMVAPGSSIMLETQALYMSAKVIDMGYGDGSMPPESFFDRFILELAVWSKS